MLPIFPEEAVVLKIARHGVFVILIDTWIMYQYLKVTLVDEKATILYVFEYEQNCNLYTTADNDVSENAVFSGNEL